MPTSRSYLLRLAAATLITILVSAALYRVAVYRDKHAFSSFRNATVAFEDTTAYDVVLLGSSRIKNVVNPAALDSTLHLNTINIGQTGITLCEDEMILSHYLSHHPAPRYLLLGLDLFSMTTDAQPLGATIQYMPWVDQKDVAHHLHKMGVHTGMYTILPFLRIMEFDDYYKSPLLGNTAYSTEIVPGDFYYKGYLSNTALHIPPVPDGDTTSHGKKMHFTIDTSGANSLNRIIILCQQHHISLAFLIAPEYKHLNTANIPNAQAIFSHYQQVATQRHIPLLRHDYLPICRDNTMFVNTGHLNRIGSSIYSKILADTLHQLGWSR